MIYTKATRFFTFSFRRKTNRVESEFIKGEGGRGYSLKPLVGNVHFSTLKKIRFMFVSSWDTMEVHLPLVGENDLFVVGLLTWNKKRKKKKLEADSKVFHLFFFFFIKK